MIPKYSILEIERRWLAVEARLPPLGGLRCMRAIDHYLDGSRLRLRRVDLGERSVFKLCKKYGRISELSEPITNIYLTEAEYGLLLGLRGRTLVRERYVYPHLGRNYSICRVLHGNGPVIVESEFESEAAARSCTPPEFCGEEVSGNSEYEAARFTAPETDRKE